MSFIPAIGRIKEQIRILTGAKVIVGFQSELGTNFNGESISSNEEMLKIAAVHEFGCDIQVTPKMRAFLHRNGLHLKADTDKIHIPERSYIRRAKTESMAGLVEEFNKDVEKMFAGKMSADDVLNNLGKRAVEGIYFALGDDTQPITDYTREHRKYNSESQPLNDTGKMARHITYRIVKKGDA